MTTNVASTETGMASPITSVDLRSRRNANSTSIASSPPHRAELSTSPIAPSMKRDWSATVTSFIWGGSDRCVSRRLTARATDTVLASPSL